MATSDAASSTPSAAAASAAGSGGGGEPLSASDLLAHRALAIEDARSGERLVLGDLWRERPVVLGFLRRLGCQM
jgi:hypothetical protein